MVGGPTRWALGHRAGLDGLRGVAVLLVVAGHVFAPWIGKAYSFVGVTIFFTLSGFLITSLLLEQGSAGTIRLRSFWARRARRLGPALLLTLMAVVALDALGLEPVSAAQVIATMLYLSNFVAAESFGLGILGHTWSLAVEEQFYLLWPLIVVPLARRPRLLLAVCGAGVAAAYVARVVIHNDERQYYSTFTRMDALLIGCALAIVLRWLGPGRTHPALALLGVGLCTAAGATITLALATTAYIPWVTALVIYTISRGDYSGLLTWRPLRTTGRISYGLYLYHFVIWVTMRDRMALPDFLTALLILTISIAVAWLSWTYIERPFLKRTPKPADAQPASALNTR